jgi:hypothetical protein
MYGMYCAMRCPACRPACSFDPSAQWRASHPRRHARSEIIGETNVGPRGEKRRRPFAASASIAPRTMRLLSIGISGPRQKSGADGARDHKMFQAPSLGMSSVHDRLPSLRAEALHRDFVQTFCFARRGVTQAATARAPLHLA